MTRSDPPGWDAAWAHVRDYFGDEDVEDKYRLLTEYLPAVFAGYFSTRAQLYAEPPAGALDRKTMELIVLAIEIAMRKSNPPPVGHAKHAIEAGATVQEVAEVVGLCITLCGMISFRESGRFVLAAADEYATGSA